LRFKKKQARMVVMIFYNYEKEKRCEIRFKFIICPIEANNIKYKEVSNLSFPIDIIFRKKEELVKQLISFLLNEEIDPDFFKNNANNNAESKE
jgi:hypothetical protein